MMFLGLPPSAPGVVIVPAVAHEVCNHMAQTTIPVYLTGKVGSIVYTPNRQGTAVRQLVTPKNPSTAGQTAQRQRFAAADKAWSGISAAARATWKTFAAKLANSNSAKSLCPNFVARCNGVSPWLSCRGASKPGQVL